MMIGRFDSFLTTGTAEMSSVKRVAVSNVRMPRSHRMTFGLCIVMYSLAASHSSMVAAMPRLKSTGLSALGRHGADLLQQAEVRHVPRADLEDVHVGVHELGVGRVDDLGEREQPVALARLGQQLAALLLEALEAVRRACAACTRRRAARGCRARRRPPRPP